MAQNARWVLMLLAAALATAGAQAGENRDRHTPIVLNGPEWFAGLVALLLLPVVVAWLMVRHIPNQQVGVGEKLRSRKGSVPEGRIIALDGEAGY